MQNEDMRRWALAWFDAGYNVVPRKSAGESHPSLKWTKLQSRRVTEAEILKWDFSGGLGFITGAISDVVVIDTDSPEADAMLRERFGTGMETRVVRSGSGRGRHYHFRHPGFFVRTLSNAAIKIDVRGDKGFCVLPPSAHKSGGVYELERDIAPAELPPGLLEFIGASVSVATPPSSAPCPAGPLVIDLLSAPSLSDARAMLDKLPDDYCEDYSKWIMVGMSMRCYGDAGFELWREWSGRSAKSEGCDFAGVWRSFVPRADGVTIATLIYEAQKQGGQQPPASKAKPGSKETFGELPPGWSAPELPDGFTYDGGALVRTVQTPGPGKNFGSVAVVVSAHPLEMAFEHSKFKGLYTVFRQWWPGEGWRSVGLSCEAIEGVTGFGKLQKELRVQDKSGFMAFYRQARSLAGAATNAHDQMGWQEDGSFLLGDRLIRKDGVTRVRVTEGLEPYAAGCAKKGTLDGWIKAFDNLNPHRDEGLGPHALMGVSAFASPLMSLALNGGQGGAIIHASDPKGGAGKTTAIELGVSAFGQFETFMLQVKDTTAGRVGKLVRVRHLSVGVEEFTARDPEVVLDDIKIIQSGTPKQVFDEEEGAKRRPGDWCLNVLTSSNEALVSHFAKMPKAFAMMHRTLDVSFEPRRFDHDIRSALDAHYGVAGERYLQILVGLGRERLRGWIEQERLRVMQKWPHVDLRFQAVHLACCSVALAIMNAEKCFNLQWSVDKVLAVGARSVEDQKRAGVLPTPIEVFQEFLALHRKNTLRVPASGGVDLEGSNFNVEPLYAVLSEREGQMWINRRVLQGFAQKRGYTWRAFIKGLGLMYLGEGQRNLGRYCHVLAQAHTGVVDIVKLDAGWVVAEAPEQVAELSRAESSLKGQVLGFPRSGRASRPRQP